MLKMQTILKTINSLAPYQLQPKPSSMEPSGGAKYLTNNAQHCPRKPLMKYGSYPLVIVEIEVTLA